MKPSQSKTPISRTKSEQARARGWLVALKLVALGVILAGAVVGASELGRMAFDRFALKNPFFEIDEISVETTGVIPREEILEWAGVRPGENIFSVDLPSVQRKLEMVSFIAAASVERRFPRELIVRVVERRPIAKVYAWWSDPGQENARTTTYYFDEEGMVMRRLPGGWQDRFFEAPMRDFPLVTGLPSLDLRVARKTSSLQVLAALKLVGEFKRAGMADITDLETVDVGDPMSLLVTTSTGTKVSLAPRGFARQLSRWRAVLGFGASQGKSLGALDLVVTNYVPVSWTPSAAPAAPARPPAPPVRRKNV